MIIPSQPRKDTLRRKCLTRTFPHHSEGLIGSCRGEASEPCEDGVCTFDRDNSCC
jgi:hypothetical protein